MVKQFLTVSTLSLLLSLTVHAKTLIHAGFLIDGKSGKAQAEMTVVLDNNQIVAVNEGYTSPGENDTMIDLKGHTVLPGLMDMHTHVTHQSGRNSYIQRFSWEEADFALRGAAITETLLMAGFTTIRDLGDSGNVSVSLQKAIERGWIVGPRIYTAAKSLATTGGHADPSNGHRQSLQGDPGPQDGVVNGVADARKAVRQRYKDGAHLIKITATGGVLSLASNSQNPQFSDQELAAIIATAKDYGMKVAAHAHGAEGMKRAVKAGVASIEHGTYMDDETMTLMKERGTYYVPTISAGKWVAEKAKIDGFFPEVVRPKAAAIGPLIQETFKKAFRAGVKIAFGTDSGVFEHGENAKEFLYMVEAGMPAMMAIQSATIEAAVLLGEDQRLGTIEAGKWADIIAVRGDPVEDITTLQRIDFVMKDGRVFKFNGNRVF